MVIQTFFVAFVVSYIGSIPPGTINVSVMQLAMMKKHRAAYFFGMAAVLVEFFYAGLTVQFQIFLSENKQLFLYFKVVTAIVLIILGIWNLRAKPAGFSYNTTLEKGRHGFFKGIILGILNPMTIPFWLAITTYLENDRLILLDQMGYWIYLIGLSLGTYALLVTVTLLSYRFTKVSENSFILYRVPGIILLLLGSYFFVKLII